MMKLYNESDNTAIHKELQKSFIRASKLYNNDIIKSSMNVIITFDTETSLISESGIYFDVSENKEKICAYNYVQMIRINNLKFYTRYLQDVVKIFHIIETFAYEQQTRVYVWVHHLGFDFTFIRQYLNAVSAKNNVERCLEVFARSAHKPMYANWRNLQFRCSYILSNMSLEMCGKTENLPSQKLTGSLNHELIRHSETQLTNDELSYCEADIDVLYEYVSVKLKAENGKMHKIPFTATSYVRRELLNTYGAKRKNAHVKTLEMHKDFNIFRILRQAFTGGYCYANPINSCKINEDVTSLDYTSSYPAICLRKKFPVKPFVKVENSSQKELKKIVNDDNIPSVFHVIFLKVQSKSTICTLSSSKCNLHSLDYYDNSALACPKNDKDYWKHIECNGKISREYIVDTVMTDVDLKVFNLYYKYAKYVILDCYISRYGYLDDQFRQAILQAYKRKTQLKGCTDTPELLTQYNNSKSFINALYGCCCFNIMNNDVIFNENNPEIWDSVEKTIEDYEKYYSNPKTILAYQTGVYITAWARYELLTTIAKINPRHFIYTDTDSIKLTNYSEYEQLFNKINNRIVLETEIALADSKIDLNEYPIAPLDKKGEKHEIGVFTDEGQCRYLKTLGAKRYLNTDFFERSYINSKEYNSHNHTFKITCAGVDKNKTSEYFTNVFNENICIYDEKTAIKNTFALFKNNMNLNSDICGRKVHYYTSIVMSDYDNPENTVEITDYTGKKATMILSDSVAIKKSAFTLTMAEMHLDYIANWHKIVNYTKCPLDDEYYTL